MKKIKYIHTGVLFVLSLLCCGMAMVSCTDWDEFKKYTAGGEITYAGKFDTAVVFPGKERVNFWGVIAPDPKINRCVIYWDNRADSIEFEVDGTGGNTPFDRIFSIAEGTKTFTVYTYDSEGNRSTPTTVTGTSYGRRYRNTLSNRRIKTVDYNKNSSTIYWDLIDRMLGPEYMEVSYQTPRGDTVVMTPATESETVLKGLDYANQAFTWRTIFRPLPSVKGVVCIDTFQTRYNRSIIPVFAETELDRSLFGEKTLPGDAGNQGGGSGGVKGMWDAGAQNDFGKVLFTNIDAGVSSPQMVTVDLGQRAYLTKIVLYPFQEWWGSYYVFSTLRDYEIYGSSNPSSNGALDGSWTLLNAGTITKISGGPKDNESADDKAAAIAGFTLPVDPDAPKVRYLRIRCLRNYESFYTGNANAFFSVAELRVFGMLPQ